MASQVRFALRLRALWVCAALPLAAQVPLPPAAQVLKPLAGKVVDAILKPKMKVDHFTVGGFKVVDVDPTSDATPEKFEGTGLLEMPPPGHPTKITFKNLVLKGSAAEGTVEADFPANHHAMVQGWLYQLKKGVFSDKGAHLEGTASLAAIRLDVKDLAFTPSGLQGSIKPGDLPLAEGHFIATLKGAEVAFAPGAVPQLNGTVRVEIELPVRHAVTGEAVVMESKPTSFSSAMLLETANGPIVDALAFNIPLLHRGTTWRMEKVSYMVERGTPYLTGPTRMQFHLNVFTQADATDQPYVSNPAFCRMWGEPAKPESRVHGRVRTLMKAADVFVGWEGFTADFPLPSATLYPSGLTSYKLMVNSGTASVVKGRITGDSKLTGKLVWGPNFSYEFAINNAPAEMADGLYVESGSMTTPAQVGAYGVYSYAGAVVCDFTESKSPAGFDPHWKGVNLPVFAVVLPGELYTLTKDNKHAATHIYGLNGHFDENGGFTASVSGSFPSHILLHFAPVTLQPFQIDFVDGVILKAAIVNGTLDVEAPPLLDKYSAPITFRFTQDGVQQIEVQGGQILKTNLIGVDTVIDRAVLNPSNLDFTGRFDFHVDGAALPSIAFDHLVFEATGGGINGDFSPIKLGISGARWDNLSDHQKVDLWGFGFNLTESGFGLKDDGRYFVGFGGQMDVNPMVPSIYNRVLFTTKPAKVTEGTVEIEKKFKIDQDMAGLGALKADLGFTVESSAGKVLTAYFLGTGHVAMNMGDAPFDMEAGVRFGRQMQGGGNSFPYFYALGHFQAQDAGVEVAPDVEIYGLVGGLAQNFKPKEIRNTTDIEGTPDASLGYALAAGVDLATTDHYTFHGGLDLYVAQNLTTLLQGKGWLFCGRDATDNEVTANISFTRHPNVFDATFAADIKQSGGMLRYIGNVALHFGPDKKFLHVGSPDAPIKAIYQGLAEGNGYFMADFEGKNSKLSAGAGFGVDTGDRDFGPLYGRAWMNARGDLVIELDPSLNPKVRGSLMANGGAAFGMKFKTFWHTYHITIFSGDFAAAMAFQAPGSPRLSGHVTIHYSVLGGAFEGNVTAHLDF